MENGKPNALVLCGAVFPHDPGPDTYLRPARMLGSFLSRQRHMGEVLVTDCSDLKATDVADIIRCFSAISSPLLLAYAGHANLNGWKINEGNRAMHEHIAPIIKDRVSPTLILEDTCRGMRFASLCQASGVNPGLTGIVGASSAYGYKLSMQVPLLIDAINCWEEGNDLPRKRIGFLKARPQYPESETVWAWSRNKRKKFRYAVFKSRWGARLDHLFRATD